MHFEVDFWVGGMPDCRCCQRWWVLDAGDMVGLKITVLKSICGRQLVLFNFYSKFYLGSRWGDQKGYNPLGEDIITSDK